ncbi:unnamed protein product [Lathyrus oleraceus]
MQVAPFSSLHNSITVSPSLQPVPAAATTTVAVQVAVITKSSLYPNSSSTSSLTRMFSLLNNGRNSCIFR